MLEDFPDETPEARWERVRRMSDDEAEARAAADPDNPPLAANERMRRVPLPKAVRQKLRLSQSEFAERYGFSVRTLQEWEQRRREPSEHVVAYLTVIAALPDAVAGVLENARVKQHVERECGSAGER